MSISRRSPAGERRQSCSLGTRRGGSPSMSRPQLSASQSAEGPQKADLARDYPILLQKPVDSPYGPYADDFSPQQHKYGPFGPIRAKVKELQGQSTRVGH